MTRLFFVMMILTAGFLRSSAQSMLKVRTADNMRINVMVDGRYFNKTGTSVTVGDLPYGRHRLRVYEASQTRRGRVFQEVIYEGKVITDPGMITILVYDPATDQTDIQEQQINSYLNDHPIPNANTGQNNSGSYDDGDNNNSAPVAAPAPVASGSLTSAKIDQLKTKVNAKKTDTDKMNTLKTELSGETFTTAQLGDMMDLFNFESAKVEFAKWAYSSTVDKDYFSDLEGKLTYKNYQDDLDKFIKDNSK